MAKQSWDDAAPAKPLDSKAVGQFGSDPKVTAPKPLDPLTKIKTDAQEAYRTLVNELCTIKIGDKNLALPKSQSQLTDWMAQG
jgi:hypothetical protein